MFGRLFVRSEKNRDAKEVGKSRTALTSPDAAYRQWLEENKERRLKVENGVPNYPDTARIAEQLVENGIVIGTTDQYLDEDGRKAFTEASKLILDKSRSGEVQAAIQSGSSNYTKKDYMIHLVPKDELYTAQNALLRLALDKKLLEIVSLYLGMWPRLHAIGAWLNFPTTEEAKQSQLWHRDPEDFRLIKVFIYLRDVDADCGPFSYIPKTQPFGLRAGTDPKHSHPKRITDDEMQGAVSSQDWIACTGPAGTMILADTVGFHRGGKPKVGNRILIAFTYTSGKPHLGGHFKVDGVPDWVSHDIQRYALSAAA
jgi:hypothetical protein